MTFQNNTLRLGYVGTQYPYITPCALKEPITCSTPGTFIDVWIEIGKMLGLELKMIKAASYGRRQSDGSYDGLMGMLLNRTIDGTASRFNFWNDRYELINFGPVLEKDNYGFIVSKPQSPYLDISHAGFSQTVWILILSLLIVVILVEYINSNLITTRKISLNDLFFHIFAKFMFKMPWKLKRNFILLLMIATLHHAYLCTLKTVSILYLSGDEVLFKNIDELKTLIGSGYRIISDRSPKSAKSILASARYKNLVESLQDDAIVQVKQKEVYEHLCDYNKEKYIFFGSLDPLKIYMQYLRREPCRTKIIPNTALFHVLSYGIRKGYRFYPKIYEMLQKFYSDPDKISRIEIKYYQQHLYDHDKSAVQKSLGVNSVQKIFKAYFAGILMCCLAFTLEVIWTKRF